MLRPHRFDKEIDPGPVQIHPVASTMINLVTSCPRPSIGSARRSEALTLVKDPRLADEMRGVIGKEATHAAGHEEVIRKFLIVTGPIRTDARTRRVHVRKGLGANNFRRGYTPEEMGSTAQAVAYLATSPAARAPHL
jgi:predicted metal-dependent hydrolase